MDIHICMDRVMVEHGAMAPILIYMNINFSNFLLRSEERRVGKECRP